MCLRAFFIVRSLKKYYAKHFINVGIEQADFEIIFPPISKKDFYYKIIADAMYNVDTGYCPTLSDSAKSFFSTSILSPFSSIRLNLLHCPSER